MSGILTDMRTLGPTSDLRETLNEMAMTNLAAEDDSDSRDRVYHAFMVIDGILKRIQAFEESELSRKN